MPAGQVYWQSSFANNALEVAEVKGARVDGIKLKEAKAYQKANFNVETETVSTTDGAGVMLYSASSSVRSASKDARKVKEDIRKAEKRRKTGSRRRSECRKPTKNRL